MKNSKTTKQQYTIQIPNSMEKPLFYYQFNSGRQYTESGQIIQCKIIPEFSYNQDAWVYSIYFYDKSRMITGHIIINYIFELDGISDSKLEKEILDFYDRLSYDSNISFSDKNIKEIISHFKKEV